MIVWGLWVETDDYYDHGQVVAVFTDPTRARHIAQVIKGACVPGVGHVYETDIVPWVVDRVPDGLFTWELPA